MNDNVHEISSRPTVRLNTRMDMSPRYDPYLERDYRNVANIANEIAEGLIREAIEYDSSLRIVLSDFEDTDISVDDCWKISEAYYGGAPLLDIKTGKTINTYSYYMGFVLTEYGEILEFEKAGDAENDTGLTHVVDIHRGIYIRRGLLSRRCYTDENMLIGLDDLAQKAGLDN